MPDTKATIRAARAAYNAAIAARDATAIAAILTEDYALVTSRGDALDGRDAVYRNWVRRFANDADVNYVRTPDIIQVDDAAGTATETGRWQGHYSADGKRIEGAGTYVARWRLEGDGRWQLRAEQFTAGP